MPVKDLFKIAFEKAAIEKQKREAKEALNAKRAALVAKKARMLAYGRKVNRRRAS